MRLYQADLQPVCDIAPQKNFPCNPFLFRGTQELAAGNDPDLNPIPCVLSWPKPGGKNQDALTSDRFFCLYILKPFSPHELP